MGVLRIPSYNINAKFFPTIVLKYLHRNNFNNHEHTVANKNKTKQKTAHTHLQQIINEIQKHETKSDE